MINNHVQIIIMIMIYLTQCCINYIKCVTISCVLLQIITVIVKHNASVQYDGYMKQRAIKTLSHLRTRESV